MLPAPCMVLFSNVLLLPVPVSLMHSVSQALEGQGLSMSACYCDGASLFLAFLCPWQDLTQSREYTLGPDCQVPRLALSVAWLSDLRHFPVSFLAKDPHPKSQ
jgi:hypothetical protein